AELCVAFKNRGIVGFDLAHAVGNLPLLMVKIQALKWFLYLSIYILYNHTSVSYFSMKFAHELELFPV
ncbi:MAG TPA: hypothetical protein PLI23_12740, partial [Thermoclostridium caenicola]|uniref:hypothetical protein n=1 Tax=Thermoclostridium caenicola TaxID=659425 RepID=UPI002B7C1142